MSHFRQTSFFDNETDPVVETDIAAEIAKIKPEAASRTGRPAEITTTQLEDWSHRLQSAAAEAGDARLLALESDLLDLRDAIVFELHKRF